MGHVLMLYIMLERQRNQDTDMDEAHRQPTAHAVAERSETCLEVFRNGGHRQDNADVLHRCHGIP